MKNKNRILVIDDDIGLRKTLLAILAAKGYETFVAGDGAEGLALLEGNSVNLVLTDLGLPDISGIDILGKVKTLYPATQVIVLTGSATFDSAVEAANLGAFSYLLKPYDIDQLLLQIQRAIEKQHADEELHLSRQMLDDVTQGITESILLISKDYKILWANRTAIAQSGLTLDEIVGQNCYTATATLQQHSPCEPPDPPCSLRDLLTSGQSKTLQHNLYDNDGNKRVLEINVYPVTDCAGDLKEFVHVSRDITERARLEEELAHKVRELEASLARVKQLEGILPICMYCKKIRDGADQWEQMEEYISKHSEANFSHGICPVCYKNQLDDLKTKRKE